MSDMPARPDEYDYRQAIYYRREKVEYFRYSPALKIDQSQFKIVVIKGSQAVNFTVGKFMVNPVLERSKDFQ